MRRRARHHVQTSTLGIIQRVVVHRQPQRQTAMVARAAAIHVARLVRDIIAASVPRKQPRPVHPTVSAAVHPVVHVQVQQRINAQRSQTTIMPARLTARLLAWAPVQPQLPSAKFCHGYLVRAEHCMNMQRIIQRLINMIPAMVMVGLMSRRDTI